MPVKALSIIFFIMLSCEISKQDAESTNVQVDPSPPPPAIPYSVHIVSSNVPSEQYTFDAVGILQIYLESYQNFDIAIPKFLQAYKEKHDSQVWKVSSGCDVLILPNDTTYIKLRETVTDVEINLFQ